MAFQLVPQLVIDMKFEDRDRNIGRSSGNIPITGVLDFASAVTYGIALVNVAQTLSDATLTSFGLRVDVADDVVPAPQAPETSDVERKGVFSFELANRQSGRFEIPSVKNGLVVDGTNVISTLDPLVAAFIAIVLNGPPGANNGFVTAGGAQYTRFLRAYKAHRGSNKG